MATTRPPSSLPAGLQGARGDEQDRIAIHDLAVGGDENGPVGIAIESHAQIGAIFEHGGAERLDVQRAAVQIDVAAVGLVADGVHVGSQMAEQRGRQLKGRAVAAIDHDAHARERA